MRTITSFCLLISLLSSFGCSSTTGALLSRDSSSVELSSTGSNHALLFVNKIVILPVKVARGVKEVVGKDRALMGALSDTVERRSQFTVVGRSVVEPLVVPYLNGGLSAATFAKRVGADAALVTEITHFEAREGSRIGVTTPGSVGFTMKLIGAQGKASGLSEATLWKTEYFFRDQPLSENVLTLGERLSSSGGFGWRSSEELLSKGFDESVRNLVESRQAAFLERK